MKRRVLILPLAALVIVGLVAYKLTRPPQEKFVPPPGELAIPAPNFQLYDSRSQPFQLSRWLGRHRLIVAFVVAPAGVDQHEQLLELRTRFEDFRDENAYIVAVTADTPYRNRQAIARGGKFPFPLLSDPMLAVHEQWGALTPDERQPLPATFVVDRSGLIRRMHVGKEEVPTADTLLGELQRLR